MKERSIIIAALFVCACQGRPTIERVASETQPRPHLTERQVLDSPSPPFLLEDVHEPSVPKPDAQDDSADTDDTKDVEANKEVLGREFHLECKPPKCISILD